MNRLLFVVILLGACSASEIAGDAARGDAATDAIAADAAPPPVAAGCVSDVSTGDHVYACGGRQVDIRVPAVCQQPGCGLILVLHGDTGNGLLMDAHIKMREKGAAAGYIVVAPTGPAFGSGYPGSTWRASDDANLVDIVEQVRDVFRVDPRKIHVTGFSRGGFVTWRLICDHADLFASAAPGGAGNGGGFGETTCFTQNRKPTTKIPLLILMGRTDVSVGYATITAIRDAAIADYGATGPTTIASDGAYRHDRWTANGTVIETFDHAYETVNPGPWSDAEGHCIPGSAFDPQGPQYAIPCKLPNAFVWGDEVLAFFMAHPR